MMDIIILFLALQMDHPAFESAELPAPAAEALTALDDLADEVLNQSKITAKDRQELLDALREIQHEIKQEPKKKRGLEPKLR